MTTALVAGVVANRPGNAGAAWTRLSWAGGLRQLGFDVHLVEQLAPTVGPNAEGWFRDVILRAGFAESATLLRADGTTATGLSHHDLVELASDAPLLVNISGHLTDREIRDRCGVRVFVDLDPGFTQFWHHDHLAPLPPHDHWLTVGMNVGNGAAIPTDDIAWRPTLQPVVLESWDVTECPADARFTTIGSWRGFGTIERDGRRLGPKAHQFRRFIDLPAFTPATLELALVIDDEDAKDRASMEEHGWRLVDPIDVAGDTDAFRSYVQSSTGEWSAAQGMYVETRSGWFSDRTTRYLASGRAAIVQDTGFSNHLPVGQGLLTFSTPDESVRAIAAVLADPVAHGRAARTIAEEHFDARRVLGRLCEEVGVAP